MAIARDQHGGAEFYALRLFGDAGEGDPYIVAEGGNLGAPDRAKAKVFFNLRIPRFEPDERLHGALANTAAEAERVAAAVELPEVVQFQRARRLVRVALAEACLSQRIDALVAELLS